jgi:hypothetical protein
MFYVVLGHLGALHYFIRARRVKLMTITREKIDLGHLCENIGKFSLFEHSEKVQKAVQGVGGGI